MLEVKINNDYKQALKDRDTIKSSTLNFLRAQLKNVMIDKKKDSLCDEDVIVVVKKQIKQRQDSIEQFEKGGRVDLVEKEKAELAVLKSYLPEELSEAQLKILIDKAVKETQAKDVKDMGKVMKLLLSEVAGRADNKLVSDLVRQALLTT